MQYVILRALVAQAPRKTVHHTTPGPFGPTKRFCPRSRSSCATVTCICSHPGLVVDFKALQTVPAHFTSACRQYVLKPTPWAAKTLRLAFSAAVWSWISTGLQSNVVPRKADTGTLPDTAGSRAFNEIPHLLELEPT